MSDVANKVKSRFSVVAKLAQACRRAPFLFVVGAFYSLAVIFLFVYVPTTNGEEWIWHVTRFGAQQNLNSLPANSGGADPFAAIATPIQVPLAQHSSPSVPIQLNAGQSQEAVAPQKGAVNPSPTNPSDSYSATAVNAPTTDPWAAVAETPVTVAPVQASRVALLPEYMLPQQAKVLGASLLILFFGYFRSEPVKLVLGRYGIVILGIALTLPVLFVPCTYVDHSPSLYNDRSFSEYCWLWNVGRSNITFSVLALEEVIVATVGCVVFLQYKRGRTT